jgi:hypothetical protein
MTDMPTSQIPIEDMHRRLREQLERRAARAKQRRLQAAEIVAACDAEDESIARDRATLAEAEKLYRNLPSKARGPVSSGQSAGDSSAAAAHKRARIGPQRYLMLAALDRQPGDAAELAKATGLPLRRVAEQMRSDIGLGIVEQAEIHEIGGPIPKYVLSAAGEDLLARFRGDRQFKGLSLPTTAEAHADAASDPMAVE